MRSRRSRRRDALLFAAWTCGALSCTGAACPLETVAPPPGALDMGAYFVNATPAVKGCELDEVTGAAFGFSLVLSANPDAGEYFMTLDGATSRGASWDGQVVRSTERARRYFRQCSECVTRLEETIELSLLSLSQAGAVGNVCPESPLDGGVPAPDDAGITGPGPREQGFDAILACGALSTRVLVDEGPADGGPCPAVCSACTMTYTLAGERR